MSTGGAELQGLANKGEQGGARRVDGGTRPHSRLLCCAALRLSAELAALSREGRDGRGGREVHGSEAERTGTAGGQGEAADADDLDRAAPPAHGHRLVTMSGTGMEAVWGLWCMDLRFEK